MLLEGHSTRATVLFEQYHSLIDFEIEQLADLAPRQFPGPITIQREGLQCAAIKLGPVEMQRLCERVWNLYRNCHQAMTLPIFEVENKRLRFRSCRSRATDFFRHETDDCGALDLVGLPNWVKLMR